MPTDRSHVRTSLRGRVDLRTCPDRRIHNLAPRLCVSIDGDRVRGVVAFDTYQGWVDVHARDDRGQLLVLGRSLRIVRRFGQVAAAVTRMTVLDATVLERAGVAIA